MDVLAFALVQVFVEWNKYKLKKGTIQLNHISGLVIIILMILHTSLNTNNEPDASLYIIESENLVITSTLEN